MDDQMWAEFTEEFLWRNPRAQVTQVVPVGVHLVKRELGEAAIKEGKAQETVAPRNNGSDSA
jgi:hypothetical protein